MVEFGHGTAMKIQRRQFLKSTAALAAISSVPARLSQAANTSRSYPYLGRTDDYTEFQVIEPGLTITKVESWTQGQYGMVRVTTHDGREGYGQLSSYEPDITATVLHRQVARHVLGSDPARIDALGENIQLMGDGNSCYTPPKAIEVGRRLEDQRYFWFEEPCPYWELEWTAEVAAALKLHIAGGEQDNDLARENQSKLAGESRLPEKRTPGIVPRTIALS
ncbi:MAG: enolase C-terminal domain-like protein [Tepidisphaeraceae bacterium]